MVVEKMKNIIGGECKHIRLLLQMEKSLSFQADLLNGVRTKVLIHRIYGRLLQVTAGNMLVDGKQ